MVGLGVEPLPRQEQRAEPAEVATGQERAVGVLLLDRPDRGGGGEQRLDAVLLDHPPERAGVRGADRLALVEHRGRAGDERRVDDVGVADDPAHVGGGPPDLPGVHVVDVRQGPRHRHGVPAVVADDALRLAGRAGGVEHVERVGGRDLDALRGVGAPGLHRQVPVDVERLAQDRLGLRALLDHHGVRPVLGELEGAVDDRACTPPPGSARCRRTPPGSPWAARRRCAPRARAARSRRRPPSARRRSGRRRASRRPPPGSSACRSPPGPPPPRRSRAGRRRRQPSARAAARSCRSSWCRRPRCRRSARCGRRGRARRAGRARCSRCSASRRGTTGRTAGARRRGPSAAS